MNISHYFEPLSFERQVFISEESSVTLKQKITAYTEGAAFPEIKSGSMAIIGVRDDRRAVGNKGCAAAPSHIRTYLYGLVTPAADLRLYDLGDIVAGDTPEDTYYALADVVCQLVLANVTMLVIGGGQDLTYAIYRGYDQAGMVVNMTAVDSRFDINDSDTVNSRSFLNHIVQQQPNFLFNFTNLGYQTYFVGAEHIKLMEELDFDAYRLGYVQEDMNRTEPLVRNADIVSVDMSALRHSDAPANAHPSPHGLYGEQLCQIARYAGVSDKVGCFGLFELNPLYDNNEQTAHLAAHALWYYIEGFHNRKEDNPLSNKENYQQFLVHMETHGVDINFYKSMLSDRWWMEVPCDDEERRQRYLRHLIIPCNYADYQRAMQNEIPELWWKYYQRFL